MPTYQAINIGKKFDKFTDQYSPKIIARMNDCHFKLARIQGEFVWHSHEDTDEAFIVVEGEMRIDFRDGSVSLKTGELYVVPRGVEHKPFAEHECRILLVEPAGTLNTGNAGGDLSAPGDVWI